MNVTRIRFSLRLVIGVSALACIVLAWPLLSAPVSAQQTKFRASRLIETLQKGQPAITSDVWRFLDREHEPYDITEIKATIGKLLANRNSAGQPILSPVVRIPAEGDDLPRWMINQVLEAGAMGIVVPKIELPSEAIKMVQAMRYPPRKDSPNVAAEPRGLRGGAIDGRMWGLKNPRDYEPVADLWPLNPVGELVALPIIETADGVKNINAILDVPGITGVTVGPGDLTRSLGEGNNWNSAASEAAYKTIAAACVAKKKYCNMYVRNPEEMKKFLNMGFKLIIRWGDS